VRSVALLFRPASLTNILSCYSNAFGRKVFGQVEENHEVWKAAGRLVGHDSGMSLFSQIF